VTDRPDEPILGGIPRKLLVAGDRSRDAGRPCTSKDLALSGLSLAAGVEIAWL
jgi:hypothetical protein